jgi:subtilisin family serine protease
MTTYCIFPKDGLRARIMELASEPERLSIEGTRQARRTLALAGIPVGRILTNTGVIDANDSVIALAAEVEGLATAERLPRALEALDAVLVDDLDEGQLARLRDVADVIENFEVPLVAPMEDADASAPDNWHLDKINVAAARAQGLDGNGVRIGIIDTGIDASHPEIAGKHVSFAEFDSSGSMISLVPRDAGDHGTEAPRRGKLRSGESIPPSPPNNQPAYAGFFA